MYPFKVLILLMNSFTSVQTYCLKCQKNLYTFAATCYIITKYQLDTFGAFMACVEVL